MPFKSKHFYNPGRNYEWLQDIFHPETYAWLEPKSRDLLLDYLVIKESAEEWGTGGLTDYSYVMTPAFKALEGTLLHIAKDLGFDLEKYKFRVGVVFSDDNLEKFYIEVLEKLEALTNEEKIDVKQWLGDANRILRHYRHSPAHYSGEVKTNYDRAFMTGDQILHTIDELCYALILNKMLKISEKDPRADARKLLASMSF